MKRHLQLLLPGLRDRGLDLALAGSGLDIEAPGIASPGIASPGIASHAIDIVDGIDPVKDSLAVIRLRRLLASNQWSLVHAHGWKAGMVSVLARCPHLRPPMVLTLHNELSPRFRGWRRMLLSSVLDLALRRSDAIVCVSTSLRRMAEERCGASSRIMATIVNGVDLFELDSIANRTSAFDRARLSRRFLVGTVCRMIPEKGISDLLQAFAIVRGSVHGAGLVLVGDGPNRTEFELEARSLGIADQATFMGWRRDALAIMREFDVFVLPSWSEGTPVTIIEAMVLGTPVVAADVGGVRDLVEHMRTGVVTRARSPQELAAAIELLLTDDRLRARLSHEAQEEARRRFDHTTMVERTIEVYEAVLR